jgi:glycerol kinase
VRGTSPPAGRAPWARPASPGLQVGPDRRQCYRPAMGVRQMEGLVLAIDQGTTGTTALLVSLDGEVLGRRNEEFPQHFPQPGWVEHEPEEIWRSVVRAVGGVLKAVPGARDRLAAVGLTNQRETALLWDADTAAPLGRALVWQDRRTAERCQQLVQAGHLARVREVTGLLIDPYFSATKVAWLLEADRALAARARRGQVQFGTIDSFLVKRLAGGARAPHVMELTNASRTLLLDLTTRAFSSEMCGLFGVPSEVLPRLVPSAGVVATTLGVDELPDGLPISGILGDQQAALFGQGCLSVGDAKCTYGTGAFVLLNTGARRVDSSARLVSTLAWQIGEEATYALEGSCFVAGAAVQWLRDGLRVISSADEIEPLARSVPDSGGVVFVPALSGLGAPHWDPDATGLITGITRGTTRGHLARATLEGIALQVHDLLMAMNEDLRSSGLPCVARLRVDGGAAKNNLLLELQAGFSRIEVARPADVESTGRGAALIAALGAGLLPGAGAGAGRVQIERTFGGPEDDSLMGAAERLGAIERWRDAIGRASARA